MMAGVGYADRSPYSSATFVVCSRYASDSTGDHDAQDVSNAIVREWTGLHRAAGTSRLLAEHDALVARLHVERGRIEQVQRGGLAR